MRRWFCGGLSVLVLMTVLSIAQSKPSGDQETIETLVQQVRELQEKVKSLEARQVETKLSPAPDPEAPSTDVDAMPTERLDGVHGIQWRGFGEVNYKALDQRVPEFASGGFVGGSASNSYLGDFDLLLTSSISDKASVLAEMVVSEGDAQSFSVGLDRALLKYDYNDHVKLSFGRFHTAIGYYNTAFHTGKWLETTADRPLVVQFGDEGGLIPTQALGVSATGSIPSGKLGLNYVAEYGSSDTIRPELKIEAGPVDENNGNGINFGVFILPDAIPGLQIGASIYHDKISDFARGPSVRLGQTIANVHTVYIAHGLELISEGFLIRHVYEHHGPIYNNVAFYSQVAKKVGRFRPFARFQYANADTNSIFDDVDLRYGPSFGVRYDFNDNIAFKTQINHTVRKGEPNLNSVHSQLAFTF